LFIFIYHGLLSMRCMSMAALHMQGHIVPGVSLPEEDIIVLHLLSLSLPA
jgi:hypothetical protein